MVSVALILKPTDGNEQHLKYAVPPITSELPTIATVIRTRYNRNVWICKQLVPATPEEVEESGIAVTTTCCCELRMWITRCRREGIEHKLAIVFGEGSVGVFVETPYTDGLRTVNNFQCNHKTISTA